MLQSIVKRIRNKFLVFAILYGGMKFYVFLQNNPMVKKGLMNLIRKDPTYQIVKSYVDKVLDHIRDHA